MTTLTATLFFVALLQVTDAELGDPTKGEVPLPASGGWHASLVLPCDVGVWTVGTIDAFPAFGCPEIFGLDDRGRLWLLVSYSGKWTPFPSVFDREWLGTLAQLDLDPSVDGPEIYVGGKRGHLFQVVPRPELVSDVALLRGFPGEEIHTLVGGDLDPSRSGQELLLFTRRGAVFEITAEPPQTGRTRFAARRLGRLPGRVRQAAVLPAVEGEAPWIVAACRFGAVLELRLSREGLESRPLTSEPMGFGRLAVAPGADPRHAVVYATRDDGLLLRFEGRPGGAWRREAVYAGPQGLRGVAAGRFFAEEGVESVAVFGYSKKVQLVWRQRGGPWQAQTIYEDVDKGHWLVACELDGRNGTDELIGSGYSGRIFLLARPPGYALEGPATAPCDDAMDGEQEAAGEVEGETEQHAAGDG